MRKLYIDYEMQDGTEGKARILAADKIKFENAARANGWPIEDGPRALSLMLYASLQRTKATESSYEEFISNELADLSVDQDEPDDPNPTA